MIADQFDAFIFDAYGVFWNGDNLIVDCLETMQKLKEMGKKIAILSNASRLSPYSVTKYGELGLLRDKHYDFYLTSGDVARYKFLSDELSFPAPHHTYYPFGRLNPELFDGSAFVSTNDLKSADFVYAGTPVKDDDSNVSVGEVERFVPLLKTFLEAKKTMFCANADYVAIETGQKRVMIQGYITKVYEDMGGQVEICGKPHGAVYEECFKRMGAGDKSRIAMVGDTLRTDILGAKRVGIKSILTTVVGITADELAKGRSLAELYVEEGVEPDYVVADASDILK